MHSLEVLLFGSGHTSTSKCFTVSSGIYLHVSTHWRSTLIPSIGCPPHSVVGCSVALDCSSEPASEGRHIIPILSLIIFGSFTVGGRLSTAWSSIAP
jgi:hypothetical protein